MATLRIRLIGDPVLRQKAREVKHVNKSLQKLLKDMAETMYEAHGVGLAGNQVGVLKRVLVVDVGEGLTELINPVILEHSGEEVGVEGCLSIPGVQGEVPRAVHLRLRGLDAEGRERWIEAEGYYARALQHEIDHLDGVLFTDRAISVEKVTPAAEVEAQETESAREV